MGTTTDPNDPRLGHGPDEKPTPMQEKYLVLTDAERKRGWVRPLRDAYQHTFNHATNRPCGVVTYMGREIAETYAKNPNFYGSTYCIECRMHRPVEEFVWIDRKGKVSDEVVGS